MIDKLRSIAVFAKVVDEGSFRGAAQSLGLVPSRVSEVVSQLEADLGVTLLYRTTRSIALTHEGRLLHENALDMLAAAETGLDAISPLSKDPTGSLRISLPAFVTQTSVMDSLSAFITKYPGVKTTLHFSDSRVDLIKAGFDVAIRAGWLEDSELIARSIGKVQRFLVASPDYLASRPAPSVPGDLEDWDWVRFDMRSEITQLIGPDGQVETVKGRSCVTVNSAAAFYELARRGHGLTAIPEHMACEGFSRGDLVHVLPDWSLAPLGLYAVWPGNARRENLTTLFVRFLAGDESLGTATGQRDQS
ncbi:MAG: LysR family transcriptional regulator [Pseudomonadota bacterium]